jgi:predicted DNA-binding transcriptional regulator YafY
MRRGSARKAGIRAPSESARSRKSIDGKPQQVRPAGILPDVSWNPVGRSVAAPDENGPIFRVGTESIRAGDQRLSLPSARDRPCYNRPVPRNAEVIRQWSILRAIEKSRGTGLTIDELAAQCSVTTRTIRRDLQALEEAGFPLYDDRSHTDGRTRWAIQGQAFRIVTAGLTLSELCALYFSRTLLEALSGTPFRDDLENAFEKLGAGLAPHMKQFLDRLPRVLVSKRDPLRARDDPRHQQIAARLIEATLHSRQTSIVYHSQSSDRTKTYLVHPYRLAHAQGGLYLLAWVPEYREVRTFALERIREASLLEDRFTPIEELPDDSFPHSLGVYSGPPERIVVHFHRSVADFVGSRQWHPSQQAEALQEGGLQLTLDVCVDRALQSWILGFGPFARVRSPAHLVQSIGAQLSEAAAQYDHHSPPESLTLAGPD